MASGSNSMYTVANAFSEPKTSPVFAWKNYLKYFAPAANQYRAFSRVGGEADDLYNQYKESYLGGSGQAAENANIYRDYAKGLFARQPNQLQDYTGVGDYLYGKFNEFRDTSAASGVRDMNSNLARLGIRPGSTGYDRLLNATRITNNLAPAFANTTNAIGRDYSSLAGNDMRQTLLRLGMANEDALGGYMDRVYERPLDVAGNRMGMINSMSDAYGKLSNNFNNNIAGWKTEETNDFARYAQPFDDWMNSYASSYGGGGGAGAGNQLQQPAMGGNQYLNQMYQPQPMPQGGYPVTPNTGSMPPAQNNQFMNEMYGTPGFNAGTGNPYTGMAGWDIA